MDTWKNLSDPNLVGKYRLFIQYVDSTTNVISQEPFTYYDNPQEAIEVGIVKYFKRSKRLQHLSIQRM